MGSLGVGLAKQGSSAANAFLSYLLHGSTANKHTLLGIQMARTHQLRQIWLLATNWGNALASFLKNHILGMLLFTVVTGVLGNFLYEYVKSKNDKKEEASSASNQEHGGADPSPLALPVDRARKPCAPDWSTCIGYENLSGTWRGKFPRGPLVSIAVDAPPSGAVSASLSIDQLACRSQLKLAHVNDSMLTTSEFFFKPVARTGGCPDIETLVMTPLATSAWFRLTRPDGSQATIVVDKKI